MIRAQFTKLLVSLVFVFAMATSSFAHRLAPSNYDLELQNYLQAGGSIEDLCSDADSTIHQGSGICEFCRIVTGAILVEPEWPHTRALLTTSSPLEFVFAQILAFENTDLSRSVRAPPHFV
ncbi:hypothetical protein ACFE33_15335 (plasmid) [Falsihalocynthiibacter sp. SS001]|uniref:hypothetical protein n=1 Tax=Falsihalocynthiibacter sp. SS001 TaxID=3349698 RepID=UPI0036D2C54B